MPIDAIENLWINAQRTNTPEGAKVSKAEADAIIAAVVSGGVTQAEVDVVEAIIQQAGQIAETADADAELDAIDFDLAGKKNLSGAGAETNLADIMRIKQEMDGLDTNRRDSAGDAAHRAHLLERASYIRQRIEIARRVPTIIDNLSYGALDWRIFDSEAKAALKEVEGAGEYANVVIRNLASRDGGKFLKRLVDQLPSDGKRTLRGIVNELDAETRSTMQNTIGRGLWNEMQRA